MKIAIISDIHGNLEALKATLEQFLLENQGKDFTNLDSITRLDLVEEN